MRLFLAALTLLAVTTPAGGQWLDRKSAGLPRTADGKPNLTAAAPRAASYRRSRQFCAPIYVLWKRMSANSASVSVRAQSRWSSQSI